MKTKNTILAAVVGLFLLAAYVGAADLGSAKETAEGGGVAGLVEALEAQGAEIQISDPFDQHFFSVAGLSILVNGQALQVFEYADAAAADADAETISPSGSSVGTSMILWVDDPHFFSQDNLVVLYVGSDAATLDLLQAGLGTQIAGR